MDRKKAERLTDREGITAQKVPWQEPSSLPCSMVKEAAALQTVSHLVNQ